MRWRGRKEDPAIRAAHIVAAASYVNARATERSARIQAKAVLTAGLLAIVAAYVGADRTTVNYPQAAPSQIGQPAEPGRGDTENPAEERVEIATCMAGVAAVKHSIKQAERAAPAVQLSRDFAARTVKYGSCDAAVWTLARLVES